MRSIEEVRLAQLLVSLGLNDCQIARSTGVPRVTVGNWRRGQLPRRAGGASCPHCGHPSHDFRSLPRPAYAYLLGLYLGDGHIAKHPKGVFRLGVTLDTRYPAIIGRRVSRVPAVGCVNVIAYSKSWPCLSPQHGPGRKHTRKIELVDWQREIVDECPEDLLRGLIHSDGYRGLNRVTTRGRTYRYPRYQFCNKSEDIKRIFCDACDLVGVEWRRMNAMTISGARRASVARLDEFIGSKA